MESTCGSVVVVSKRYTAKAKGIAGSVIELYNKVDSWYSDCEGEAMKQNLDVLDMHTP